VAEQFEEEAECLVHHAQPGVVARQSREHVPFDVRPPLALYQTGRRSKTNFSVGLFSSMPLCECEMC